MAATLDTAQACGWRKMTGLTCGPHLSVARRRRERRSRLGASEVASGPWPSASPRVGREGRKEGMGQRGSGPTTCLAERRGKRSGPKETRETSSAGWVTDREVANRTGLHLTELTRARIRSEIRNRELLAEQRQKLATR
uniref:Uncharacterized protein n=1 Tax=Oryza brachyantha TaxID=4533 RepID=J3N198_ORYBR